MTGTDVLVLGSYNRDVVVSLPRMPDVGETLGGCAIAFAHGGKGSNQAIQAARCGAHVRLVAAIGADPAGEEALALWRREEIDISAVRQAAHARTGAAIVLVEPSGDNRIAVDPGANAALSMDVTRCLDLSTVSVAVGSLEIPADVVARVFEQAQAQGVKTILNAAPMDSASVRGLAGQTDVLVVNLGEALVLLGCVVPAEQACAALTDAAHDWPAVIVTCGADGAWLGASGRAPVHRAGLHVHAVDTTGAGDAFVGALAACLAQGASLDDAALFANAAGALACTKSGAEPSLAPRGLIERALLGG